MDSFDSVVDLGEDIAIVLGLRIQRRELQQVPEVFAADIPAEVVHDRIAAVAAGLDGNPPDALALAVESWAEELLDRRRPAEGADREGLAEVSHLGRLAGPRVAVVANRLGRVARGSDGLPHRMWSTVRCRGGAIRAGEGAFWSDSAFGVQPPLTDEMVIDAEVILGVRLPSALLELLRVQNGGGVVDAWNSFPTTQPTSWCDSHVPFDTVEGIGTAKGTISLLDTPYLVQEWGLPSPLVLLTGDGHWWIALDYSGCWPGGEPSVSRFDTELDQEQHLAADFRTFVESLTCEPDDATP